MQETFLHFVVLKPHSRLCVSNYFCWI